MTTTNQFNRTEAKVIAIKLTKANNGAANAVTAKLPQQAYIVDIKANAPTAFNGTGTVTVSMTDGTTTFISAEDVKTAAGPVVVDVAQKAFVAGGTLQAYIADANSNSSAGEVWISVSYIEMYGCEDIYG